MLDGAPPNKIKLAFVRAIIATFDKGRWFELGLLTDTEEAIRDHPRLLRALSFGDEDYSVAVHDVLPTVLGEKQQSGGDRFFANLGVVENFVGLSHWLATNDYDLYQELYGEGTPASAQAKRAVPKTLQPGGDTTATDPRAESSAAAERPISTDETIATSVPMGTTEIPRRKVFLVHGRDLKMRDALVALLRAFDLRIIDWDEASRATGIATPYTGDVIVAGMDAADVVVVLFTPDDVGFVQPHFRQTHDGPNELQPTGQARLNVVFEAGMAMARDRDHVVIVEVGQVRAMSDTAGLNVLRLADDVSSRRRLGSRLSTAGLAVHMDHDAWMSAGDFKHAAVAATTAGDLHRTSEGAAAPIPDPPTASRVPADLGMSHTKDAVTLLKAYLPVSDKRIALEELVEDTTKAVAVAVVEFPQPSAGTPDVIQEYLDSLFIQAEPILDLLVAGIRFDRKHEFADLWTGAIRRLMQVRKAPQSGQRSSDLWERSRHFPALLALRAAGIVAVHYEYDAALISMLRDATWRDWRSSGQVIPAAVALHDYKVLDPGIINSFPRWNGTRWIYPISHYLRDMLRDTLRVAIPDDEDYKAASNGYEFRVALVQWHYKDEPGAYRSAPGEFIGEWEWGQDGKPLAEVEFRSAATKTGASTWRSVAPTEKLDGILDGLREYLANIQHGAS